MRRRRAADPVLLTPFAFRHPCMYVRICVCVTLYGVQADSLFLRCIKRRRVKARRSREPQSIVNVRLKNS